MTSPRGLSRPALFSLLLHAALIAVLVLAARQTVMTEPAPVSVELWSAAPVATVAAPQPVAQPVVPPPQPQTVTPAEAPKADVQLAHKPEPKKQEASHPSVRQPPKPAAPPAPKPEPKAKPVPPPVSKAKPASKHPIDDSNDLLSELGSSTHAPNSKVTQAGAANGVAGGVPNGSAQARDNYAAKVRAKILPLVQLPPGLQGNPKAVVQVVLLPTLEVRSVTLLQSSGNHAYDEAVQRAIREAGTFPSLPAGTRFGDVRQLKLEFRPS
ncbi:MULTISPECIES: energy transducer TonB [unclassified Paludibacterium]|uniref:energy transducer TonB n=1 Tax=unclassified Paludibacterium TaxID=2618429 RepID=UPI001C04295A|nr:energy transducer TonB [Paludibacterium sp. B53371]BEV72451.1 hypothetical protein THUN1379_19330 [Paludibacterium sp. THUN1379]